MPAFSARSNNVLNTVHPDLQRVFRRVVQRFDCTVLPDGGRRTPDRQQELVDSGASQTLNSKHLTGNAVDVAPWPLDWDDTDRFRAFGGYVIGIAQQAGVELRWGGDWDGDWCFTDQTFHDLPHFELA